MLFRPLAVNQHANPPAPLDRTSRFFSSTTLYKQQTTLGIAQTALGAVAHLRDSKCRTVVGRGRNFLAGGGHRASSSADLNLFQIQRYLFEVS